MFREELSVPIVPPLMVSVPVPAAKSLPRVKVPEFRVTPEPKLFEAERTNTPVPAAVFVSTRPPVTPVTAPEMVKVWLELLVIVLTPVTVTVFEKVAVLAEILEIPKLPPIATVLFQPLELVKL